MTRWFLTLNLKCTISATPCIYRKSIYVGREPRECLNYLGNPTEARTSYYIKVDAIPGCRCHKCKVRSNCERRQLCENVLRRSFLFTGVTEDRKRGFLSFIHQTRVFSMYTFRQIYTHERPYTFLSEMTSTLYPLFARKRLRFWKLYTMCGAEL